MKNRIFLIIFLNFVLISYCGAQNYATCDHETFRVFADDIVSEGNRQYANSYRKGIAMAADSLEHVLKARSAVGKLHQTDSLVYTADLLKLRADWHYENGNYDQNSYRMAEQLFKQAVDIYATHNDLPNSLNGLPIIQRDLAQLMYKLNRYEEAKSYTWGAYSAYVSAYNNENFYDTDEEYATMLDLRSQLALCDARVGKTDSALLFINQLLNEYPHNSDNYFEMLRKRGKIVMLLGEKDCEKKALQDYKTFLDWRKKDALKALGKMTSEQREDYWMRIRPFVADCYQLESADPAFLYDVTLFSKGLLLQLNRFSSDGVANEEALNSLKYTWKDIQNKLPEDACAIEFIQYEKNGNNLMGALVLKKKGTPQWVSIMAPDSFLNYDVVNDGVVNKKRVYSTTGRTKDAMYMDSILKRKFWSSTLEKQIGDAKKIYFAPDGYIHQVAVEYMLPQSMNEKIGYRLTSTRRLMEKSKIRTDGALIIGGVMYDKIDNTESPVGENDEQARDYMRGIGFSYLRGSLAESDSIYAIRSCPRDSLLTGQAATEAAIRTLCGQYPILNISTHGYFRSAEIPQSTDVKTSMSDESMSQCVLAMAGANVGVAAATQDSASMDGLLSAREIAQCDMQNVDLAVISACQTGLGYITADGVFGIQRGLKNAGVSCLIVSLWSVHDRATCLLMAYFHENMQKGMTVHEAFMDAREALSKPKSSAGKKRLMFDPETLTDEFVGGDEDVYDEPQYRNAFILIDAIE